jgi:hypothetical protein
MFQGILSKFIELPTCKGCYVDASRACPLHHNMPQVSWHCLGIEQAEDNFPSSYTTKKVMLLADKRRQGRSV